MNKHTFAALIGVTARRVDQMIAENSLVLTARKQIDPVPSLVRLLSAAREKSRARSGRDALERAQLAAAGIKADRLLRKFMTISEFAELAHGIIEPLAEIAQQQSSLIYHEISADVSEPLARQVAARFHRTVMGLFTTARDQVNVLKRETLQDRLNSQTRTAEILAKYFPRQSGDEAVKVEH